MGVWGCLQLPRRTDTTTQIILRMCLEPWKINIHTHVPLWIRSGDWHVYWRETGSGCRSPMMLQIETLWDLEHLDDNLSQAQPGSYCWVLTHVHVNFSKHCRLFFQNLWTHLQNLCAGATHTSPCHVSLPTLAVIHLSIVVSWGCEVL